MDLFIETLTGTAFELRVSPNDTVMSIKSKIQRVEGIPIGQQHLIWRNDELSDHQSLRDCSIPGGATLRLVLGLRGGPINTYRTPTIRLAPIHLASPSFERMMTPPRSTTSNCRATAVVPPHHLVVSGLSTKPSLNESADNGCVAKEVDAHTSQLSAPSCNSNQSDAKMKTKVEMTAMPNNLTNLTDLSGSLNVGASSNNRKQITFVIFNSGGDNLNLIRVLDRNSSSEKLESMDDSISKTKMAVGDVYSGCDISTAFANSHSLSHLQTEPAVDRDSDGDAANQCTEGSGSVVVMATTAGSSSDTPVRSLTTSTPMPAEPIRRPPSKIKSISPFTALSSSAQKSSQQPFIPTSQTTTSTPSGTSSAAAAALLAGLFYAAGPRSRGSADSLEDDLISSDGERSLFPCTAATAAAAAAAASSYWLRASSPEWDYQDVNNLCQTTGNLGDEEDDDPTALHSELPFYDVESDDPAGGSGPDDDDSLADLEDYFLYYRTGDILFGPSPRHAILRDSIFGCGSESGKKRAPQERTSIIKREERNHLAEKVKNIKAQLSQARENRLQRRQKASGEVNSASEPKSLPGNGKKSEDAKSLPEDIPRNVTISTSSAPAPVFLPKLRHSIPPVSRLGFRNQKTPTASLLPINRPHTSSTEVTSASATRLRLLGRCTTPPVDSSVLKCHSFDLRARPITASITPPKSPLGSLNHDKLRSSRLRPSPTFAAPMKKIPGVSGFNRTLQSLHSAADGSGDNQTPGNSMNPIASRQRRFGTVQPPDISRITDSLFPSLFPLESRSSPSTCSEGGVRLSKSITDAIRTDHVTQKTAPMHLSEIRLPQLSPAHMSVRSQPNISSGKTVGNDGNCSPPLLRQVTNRRQSSLYGDDAPTSGGLKSRNDFSEPPTNRRTTPQSKSSRCASCNRKTGLANSYSCRCEQNFCSRHRYAELHACPFDYKAEARRCLQENNPVITAAKLPKI